MSDYPPPPMSAAGTKAGPLRRLGARIIDGLVMLIPVLVVSAIFGGASVSVGGEADGAAILASLVGVAITFAYFVYMESNKGATVGKKALGMTVHDASGGAITTEQSAKRNAYMFLGVVPFIGGLLSLAAAIGIAITVNSDPEGQGFHDKWAGALVRRNS